MTTTIRTELEGLLDTMELSSHRFDSLFRTHTHTRDEDALAGFQKQTRDAVDTGRRLLKRPRQPKLILQPPGSLGTSTVAARLIARRALRIPPPVAPAEGTAPHLPKRRFH